MEDRISNLPDHLLQHILRLLPLKDAVRTSILSKRWRKMDVCCTLPDLNFMHGFFENRRLKKNRRSLNVLDKLLRRRGSNHNIEKFQVLIPTKYTQTPHPSLASLELISQCPLQMKLERWMKVVANPSLTVLDLRIFFRRNSYYDFPLTTLAAAESLKTLSLAGFQLMPLSSDRVDVSFPCLEQLSLESIAIDDYVMQKMLKGSPLLENLKLLCCKGLENLKVEGLGRLKMLQVTEHRLQRIVIDSPCLRVLKIVAPRSIITVATCPQFLEQLGCELKDTGNNIFQFEGIQLPIEKWFCGFMDKCRFLEHLSLSCTPTVKKIDIPSIMPALKTLNLFDPHNLVSLKIDAPKLEKFWMVLKPELPSFVSLNASKNLEVLLCFHGFVPKNEWYTRWAKFLSYFKHSRSLMIAAPKDCG